MRGTVRFEAIVVARLMKWWTVLLLASAVVVARWPLWMPVASGPPFSAENGRYTAVPVAMPMGPRPVHRGEPIYTMPVDERLVSFAVNVDWGAEFLPRMLQVLEEHNTKVTFFPTGRWAALEPELLRELVRAGHELGNHGYRHDRPKALGDEALREHITRSQQLLRDLTGVTTRLYAPPYGEVDARIARISAETDHWTIMWTVDTVDWQRPAPEVIVRRVVPKVQPGAIVLMHPTEPTVAALPTILDMLTAEGWTIVPVGTMLDRALTAQSETGGRAGPISHEPAVNGASVSSFPK